MSALPIHALTALPFLAYGEWQAAAFCVLPDLTWLPHEVQYRRSRVRPWAAWVQSPGALMPGVLLAYRLAHSSALVMSAGALCVALNVPHAGACLLAYMTHLVLDLPTHYGALSQRPLYPFSNWRWPWTI